jgi:hypothetical protein
MDIVLILNMHSFPIVMCSRIGCDLLEFCSEDILPMVAQAWCCYIVPQLQQQQWQTVGDLAQ